ncbi:MAG: DUF1080 domain-containing protein [Planctomycetes bacterium]|nr:DUF1080 domain-containing protein [Planctomycetota bacterium]
MRLLICSALCLALAVPTFAEDKGGENNAPPRGFKALFNGKNLDGWRGLSHPESNPYKLAEMSDEDRDALYGKNWEEAIKHWTVEDGELVNDGHGFYFTTKEEFSDYELWVDYKTVAKADSGIYLKYNPQVQIWDYTKEGGKWKIGADKGSGGLWNNRKGAPGKDPAILADKPFGEWNRFRIIQLGARTWVWLNGKLVVENATHENFWNRKNPLINKGAIQLQTHGGEIRWRNIFIKEIGSEEANSLLAGSDAGFESIFNGSDLAGWAGPVGNYEIVDRAIRCKPKSGGTIYWNKEISDFVARLEFKLPPGGNNGLAIRYPGKGDTAYVGMTELQVLDNTAQKYAKLDKRQYHGSAYGMVASHRGYQRPVGEWNYQEVTVKGSTIKVELNGSVILNADLATVKDFMGGRPHPGMKRTSGFFGFAGHGDPVEFRNVRVKQLVTEKTASLD